jgi:hypothetical protein
MVLVSGLRAGLDTGASVESVEIFDRSGLDAAGKLRASYGIREIAP